jgi:Family of unknown function (DUF6152)
MRRFMLLVSLLGVGLTVAPTVQAHHAVQAQFDVNKQETFTGTLVKVDWFNPHAWFHFEVKRKDGTVEQWATETVGPNGLSRFGLDRGQFVIGEVYRVEYNPDRSGARFGLTKAFTLPDGKYVKVFRGFTIFDAARSTLDAGKGGLDEARTQAPGDLDPESKEWPGATP